MACFNRRLFLQSSAAGFLGATGAIAGLGHTQAFAQSVDGYKALVGIFLKGGADMFDAVLPYDSASYQAFREVRPGILNAHSKGARSRDHLLELRPHNASAFCGRKFALAPELTALKTMFDQEEMALIGSVGPLLAPTSRTGLERSVDAVPKGLFSHNDQQSAWMTLGNEEHQGGWGGRFMDKAICSGWLRPSTCALISTGGGDTFFKREKGQSDDLFAERGATASSGPITGLSIPFPKTRLGLQLEQIAGHIRERGLRNEGRQIFYVDMGGFDTHSHQSDKIPGLLSDLSQSMAAFREALISMGVWESVTTFTMSDFGRTLTENGDGTDHGWGSHQFVMGGAVQGGQIYGAMPELDPASDRFTRTLVRLIPSVAVDQYAATLGRWFGLDSGEIGRVLPNLNRFNPASMNFMTGVTV